AQKLKDEGNALFTRKDYASAIVKYTEAISPDQDNPILYANRSACQLNLRQEQYPIDGAPHYCSNQATELNPSYGKAWARLATAKDALRQPWNSVKAWQSAIDSLPKYSESLTESGRRQKLEYETGLAGATRTLESFKAWGDDDH
ncbi:hypothetical protein L218DRAFT_867341, partial [Marasmius fiardii PR-910]